MCGIVGVFMLNDDPTPPVHGLSDAMERLALRGPDADGVYTGPGVAFGHRRLAVIDPEGGVQPWIDAETGVVVVFNGEIYNHATLRAELGAKGHRFRSRSDTEVLARAYLEWGSGCMTRFDGMFAFAVWDPRDRSLSLVRDRLGVKPLFYVPGSERLAFASSVAALRALPGVTGRLDLDAVSHYLTTVRTTLGSRTLLADVRTLEPGQALRVERGGAPRTWTWWALPVVPAAEKAPRAPGAAAAELRELLDRSVRDRLVADVPVGSFLSGGIDSAVVASVAGPATARTLRTYSVGFRRDGFNEWPFVRESAGHLGVTNTEIVLSEDGYVDGWTALMTEKGTPLSTPNEVGIHHLASALRSECVVALTGEGADEILGGYTIPYFGAFDFDRADGASPELRAALNRLYGRDRFSSRLEHFFLLNSWMSSRAKWGLLDESVGHVLRRDDSVCGYYGGLLDRVAECSTMDAYLHTHARVNLEGLLSRVDSSTMAASVEARVPFTDHHLVEWAFGLPDELKLAFRDDGAARRGADLNVVDIDRAGLLDSKRVLRRAYRADLPPAVVDRPKMSFPTPFLEVFAGPLRETVTTVFEDSPLSGTLFRPEALRALAGGRDIALWPVANLCVWSLIGDGISI